MPSRPRVAVVGHVEWIEFARVPRLPRPGEIMHATEWWQDAGGGGAVAAVQLAKLAGACDFFTALAEDNHGRAAKDRLEELGVTVFAAPRDGSQRRGFVYLDGDGERTITLGNRQAAAFIPMPGVEEAELAEAAQYASLADETPEGRSSVVLAKQYGLREHELLR